MEVLDGRDGIKSGPSTSVDAKRLDLDPPCSSSTSGTVHGQSKKFRGGCWSCFKRQAFDPEDAVYPSITKKLVAKLEDREEDSRRGRFIKRREINPNSYITLHKDITTGKFAVYYFGTEKSSNEPKIVKIYRPTVFGGCSRRAGLEKQILSLGGKPAALPSVHFAFSYQFYKCLVLEPMRNVSLKEKLLYARRLVPEVVRSFMVDMICALSFLHLRNIIHRNLTLDSWWIQANCHLKLTDYTYCIHKRSCSRWSPIFRVKTTEFTAPEMLTYSPYSRQTDIWALGIIFYRMSSGRFPFYGISSKDLRRNIRKTAEQYLEFFTEYGKKLCSEMLEKEPAHRIGHLARTDVAFKSHIYFENTDWEAARQQSKNGPPISWRFPVIGKTTETVSDAPLTINFQDPRSLDLKKMKVKPLRIKAIKHGNYWFSPEYLEQQFPREISNHGKSENEFRKLRCSNARRFSLQNHLLGALKGLEKDLAEGTQTEEDVINGFFSSIGKKFERYTEEKKTANRLKISTTDVIEETESEEELEPGDEENFAVSHFGSFVSRASTV